MKSIQSGLNSSEKLLLVSSPSGAIYMSTDALESTIFIVIGLPPDWKLLHFKCHYVVIGATMSFEQNNEPKLVKLLPKRFH